MVPASRTPRELLLASIDRRGLKGYQASPDAAWAVFPPAFEGGSIIEVMYLPRSRRYRVVSSRVMGATGRAAVTLGAFRTSDEAATCVEDALAHDMPVHGEARVAQR